MKAKVTRNVSVRSTLDYLQQTTKHHERIAGNVIAATPKAQAEEFRAFEQLRPDIAKATWHASLSLPPGEHLDTNHWSNICEDFMVGMGLDSHLWVAVRHRDCTHDHVHIVASRIGLDGAIWLGQHDARRAMALTSELESKHGLQQTKPYDEEYTSGRKRLSKNEIEMSLRSNNLAPRAALQGAIDSAVADRPGLIEFVDRLEAAGIGVRVNCTPSGFVSGLSYCLDEINMKSSQLGKAYGWSKLQMELNYDQERDSHQVAEWATARNAADAAPRGKAEQTGSGFSSGTQPDRRATGFNGRQLDTDAATPGSGHPSIEGDGSALADHNYRREAFRGNGSRSRIRGTGSGAVASATRRASEAKLVEIRPRRRLVRGTYAHLIESLAITGVSTQDTSRLETERSSHRTESCDDSARTERPQYGKKAPETTRPIREIER